MVTKASKARPETDTPGSASIRDSASQIWMAGLGAFAKAQEEGGKVFDTLVREGTAIQRKTQAVAEEKMAEAAGQMAGMANDLSQRASGQLGKLEGIFEARVAQALQRLGVPTAREVKALHERIADLEAALKAAQKPATPAKKTRTAARKSRS